MRGNGDGVAVVMPHDNQREIPEPLVIGSSTEINGSLFTDTIVQKHCSLHVRGSLIGSLTIEEGATSSSTVRSKEKLSIAEAASSSTTRG